MSVVLLIDGHHESVPVATESVFGDVWVPLARALELSSIPLLQEGVTLDEELGPQVLSELQVMLTHLEGLPANSRYRELIPRLERLTRELATLKETGRWGSAWIG